MRLFLFYFPLARISYNVDILSGFSSSCGDPGIPDIGGNATVILVGGLRVDCLYVIIELLVEECLFGRPIPVDPLRVRIGFANGSGFLCLDPYEHEVVDDESLKRKFGIIDRP